MVFFEVFGMLKYTVQVFLKNKQSDKDKSSKNVILVPSVWSPLAVNHLCQTMSEQNAAKFSADDLILQHVAK